MSVTAAGFAALFLQLFCSSGPDAEQLYLPEEYISDLGFVHVAVRTLGFEDLAGNDLSR